MRGSQSLHTGARQRVGSTAVLVISRWHDVRSGKERARWCRSSRIRCPPGCVRCKARLLDRVGEAIRMRHYRRRTEQAYVDWVRRFVLFHGKACRCLDDDDVPARAERGWTRRAEPARPVVSRSRHGGMAARLRSHSRLAVPAVGCVAESVCSHRIFSQPTSLTQPHRIRQGIDSLELPSQLAVGATDTGCEGGCSMAPLR